MHLHPEAENGAVCACHFVTLHASGWRKTFEANSSMVVAVSSSPAILRNTAPSDNRPGGRWPGFLAPAPALATGTFHQPRAPVLAEAKSCEITKRTHTRQVCVYTCCGTGVHPVHAGCGRLPLPHTCPGPRRTAATVDWYGILAVMPAHDRTRDSSSRLPILACDGFPSITPSQIAL